MAVRRRLSRGPASAAALAAGILVGWAGSVSAQPSCLAELEPNDEAGAAQVLEDSGCLEGSLPTGDQDLALWEVRASDARQRWSFSVDGQPGLLTALKLFRVTSDPGAATLEVDRSHLLEVARQPDDLEAGVAEDVLLPVGRYLLGISRNSAAGTEGTVEPGYRYTIERGRELAATADPEPNDRAGEGELLAGTTSVSGDLDGSIDYFRWEVPDTAERWSIELQVPLGSAAAIELVDPSGEVIDDVRRESAARSLDLELDPGTYSIGVSPRAYEPTPYELTISAGPVEGEPEPNDSSDRAVPLEVGVPQVGRLGGSGDRDRYRIDVPVGDGRLRDIRVIWDSDDRHRLCLVDDATDDDIICADGSGGIALTELGLPSGSNTLELSGTSDAVVPYLIRLDETSDQAPDFELEPNETLALATPLDPDLGMRGRVDMDDVDVYRLRTSGPPELWEVRLEDGAGARLEWVTASGRVLDLGEPSSSDGSVRLTDLYLVPGEHWFRVTRGARDYRLTATSLGPPGPGAELEPNGEPILADRYRIGQRRTGRLAVDGDVDIYRLSLAAPQHVRLELDQPGEARTRLILRQGPERIVDIAGLEAGGTLRYDGWLLPGDYLVELRPEQPSDEAYALLSERLDPFTLAVDQEPNDSPSGARAVPSSLTWNGDAVDGDDVDWYRLPPLDSAEPLRVAISDERATLRLEGPDGRIQHRAEAPGVRVAEDLPSGGQVHLVVQADGPYEVRIEGAGLVPAPDPVAPPVDLAWSVPTSTIAAYWPDAQRVEAAVELANRGDTSVRVELAAVTSHHLWEVALPTETVELEPGASVSAPVTISVRPDAWADDPVMITVAATDAAGGSVTSSTELVAQPDAAAVAPGDRWPLPDALIGAVNVAATSLGAEPGGSVAPQLEAQLYDGVTPDGGGFAAPNGDLPLELTVDLAGDEPVLVAGTILNPQARDGRPGAIPREFEMLLSLDGVEWRSALAGTLSPLPIDQAFALDTPIAATHATLRILSTQSDAVGLPALGEWQVLAAPGVMPVDGPLDIASRALGGHVVRLRPAGAAPASADGIISDDTKRERILLGADTDFELTLGFRHGRAAQVVGLEWIDPDGSRASDRLESVAVSVSRLGPFGPWEPVGEWSLSRSGGTVEPLQLDPPVWARYVRLTGAAPTDARELELPGRVRVIERTADDDYRSIIGAWGEDSAQGPYEWLVPADPSDTFSASAADAANEPDAATVLPPGTAVSDRVEIDVDEDWYRIDVPVDANTLEMRLAGQPTVRTSLELYDEEGTRRPLAFEARPDGSVVYQAAVEPGGSYRLRVRQPPFSAVFTFDTSGSMAPFEDLVIEGMRAFASDVQQGREAVTIVPFEEAPLLPGWDDDAYRLQEAVASYDGSGGSSGAEAGLIASTDLLAEREGARAILLVTDAETSTSQLQTELWDRLERVRPIIFSVHIGATGRPHEARSLMQAWAASGGGHYAYPTTHGEMDRAFERMSTWLRRPADYQLSYSTLDLSPASLAVRAPAEGSATGLAPGVGVEIILDTSGSMREKLDGRRRIDIAKEALRTLVNDTLVEGTPVALRSFGGKGKRAKALCQSRLLQPLEPLDRRDMLDLVGRLRAQKKTKTPIAAALRATAEDLAGATGPRSVVLVTDGAETCDGDPAATIEELRAAGLDITLNIVGFALEDEAVKADMQAWAAAGDGSYFDAAGADELTTSLRVALGAPFRVYGPDGEVYEGGSVGGDPITIDPGTFRVEVLTEPIIEFEEVVIGGGEAVTLELPS